MAVRQRCQSSDDRRFDRCHVVTVFCNVAGWFVFSCQGLFIAVLMHPGFSAAFADETQTTRVADSAIERSLSDLASPDFAARQTAADILRNASADELRQACHNLEENPHGEVVRRIIEILERRFEDGDLKSSAVGVASEALEKAAESQRWFVAEAAKDVLQRHWQRRVEVAVLELVKMNVALSPADPTELWNADPAENRRPFGGQDPTSSQHLKIFVKRNWPADPRAFELLKRLESLRGDMFLVQPTLVSIYLIDGHPMTIEQSAVLKGIFGDTRIAERGRVCLGILNETRNGTEAGILVSSVQAESSAADAGIVRGDIILGINGKTLADFEELVTELRKYDVGDKVTLQVRGGRLPDDNSVRDVEVTLRDWH